MQFWCGGRKSLRQCACTPTRMEYVGYLMMSGHHPDKLDTQVIELLGRQRLIAELLRDGLEVALPVRDRGVDLVAYADLSRQKSTGSSPARSK